MKEENTIHKIETPITGHYARAGLPGWPGTRWDVELPFGEYVVVGEIGTLILLAVWLGKAPSTKHYYFVEKSEWERRN